MSRTRFAALHYVTSLVGTVAGVGVALVVTPLVLHWLDHERFGAYRVASDWFAYLGLLDLGLSVALRAILARHVAAHDETSTQETLALGVRAYLYLAGIMLAAGLLFLVFVSRLIPIRNDALGDLRVGGLIYLATIVFVPLSPFRALVEVFQRGYLVNVLLLVQTLLTGVFAVVTARLGWGISGQFLSVAIGQMPMPVVLAMVALRGRKFPNPFRPMDPAALRSGELWALNRDVLILSACGRVGYLSDTIIASYFLGAAAIVPLVLSQRSISTAQAQVQTVGMAAWAGLAELYARGELPLFRERVVEVTRLTAILASCTLAPLVAYTAPFVRLWVGSSGYAGDNLVIASAASAFQLAILSVWCWVFVGAGLIRAILPAYVVSTIINVIASTLFTRRWGLIGPTLGTVLALTTVQFWSLPILMRRNFGLSALRLGRAVAEPFAYGVVFAAALMLLRRVFAPTTWLSLCLALGASGSTFLLLSWFAILGAAERRLWVARLRALFARKAQP